MHPDTRKIATHMKEFGLCLFGRAVVDVIFAEIMNPYAHAMGVVRCAHAAEILIKARIADEHPLLIFSKLPGPTQEDKKHLDIDTLINEGKTLVYGDLPNALWSATGYRINDIDRFQSFGRLRNTITHLAVPEIDLSKATLEFAFQILEPIIFDFWKTDVVEYMEEYDADPEEALREQLDNLNICFSRRRKPGSDHGFR